MEKDKIKNIIKKKENNLKKCDFCNNECEIKTNNLNYCYKHYVDNEPDECLCSDLHYHLYIEKQLEDDSEISESSKKLVKLIIKKYPNLVELFNSDIEKYLNGEKVYDTN